MADTNQEQLLSDLLRGIALHDARLETPHLESRVLASAFARTEPSFGGTRRFSSTIAAAAVIAALLPAVFWLNTEPPKTGRAVETTEAVVAEKPAVAIREQSPPPRTAARRPSLPTRPTQPAIATRVPEPIAQSPVAQSPDEFLPLMPMTEYELTGSFQLVRVQMPRASLGALRSPLEHPNELVEADVLLGEDGMARAIRLSTSGFCSTLEVSMNRMHVVGLLIVLAGVAARAQEPPDRMAYTSPINIDFMSEPIAFDPEPVADAPYSAEAITDVVQTLSDGNRIVKQNKAQISRDSHGRTRREQGFAMFGPLMTGPRPDQLRSVQISDPATGGAIFLDLQGKTAHKVPAPPRMMLRNKIVAVNASAGVAGERVNVEKFEMALPAPPEARGVVMFNRAEAMAAQRVEKPVVESLGTQFMEGVAVEGTRTTVTIPAGEIGNERPINIVSERWFSPDLRVLVMSRQSDPRFGETTYRLTNITRAEPSPQLFEIPADFTIVDAALLK